MRRGEIWLVNLDPTIGAEMQKTRPAIIVSDDDVGILLLKVIVPLTDWKEQYGREGWMTRVQPSDQTGLRKVSAADAFQVRSISQARFVRRIGVVSASVMDEITDSLAVVLKIDKVE